MDICSLPPRAWCSLNIFRKPWHWILISDLRFDFQHNSTWASSVCIRDMFSKNCYKMATDSLVIYTKPFSRSHSHDSQFSCHRPCLYNIATTWPTFCMWAYKDTCMYAHTYLHRHLHRRYRFGGFYDQWRTVIATPSTSKSWTILDSKTLRFHCSCDPPQL